MHLGKFVVFRLSILTLSEDVRVCRRESEEEEFDPNNVELICAPLVLCVVETKSFEMSLYMDCKRRTREAVRRRSGKARARRTQTRRWQRQRRAW